MFDDKLSTNLLLKFGQFIEWGLPLNTGSKPLVHSYNLYF